MITLRTFSIAAVLLAALTSTASAAGIKSNAYGDAAKNEAADRSITLSSTTKWVNVTDGEVVRFNKDGRSFAWRFSTLNGAPFDLSAIAPAGVDVKGVRVFVDADPALSGA